MNFDITRQSLFKTILYFLFMFIIFRSREYLFVPPSAMMPNMLYLESLINGFMRSVPFLETIASFLLAFINSFYITRIISRNLIFLERSYMPSLIYLMVSVGYYSSSNTTIVLLVAFLILFAIDNIINSYRQSFRLRYIFNASISIGFAALIYAPSVVFVLFLLLCSFVFMWNFRERIISLAALLIPIFFQSYIIWGLGGDFLSTIHQIISITTTYPGNNLSFAAWDYVLLLVFAAVLILSFITFWRKRIGMRKHSLNAYYIFVWVFIISALMFALPCRSLDMLPIMAIPVSVIIPTYFNRKQGYIPNLLYALIIWSLLLYNIMPFIKEYF